jgi:hypothetical protein
VRLVLCGTTHLKGNRTKTPIVRYLLLLFAVTTRKQTQCVVDISKGALPTKFSGIAIS